LVTLTKRVNAPGISEVRMATFTLEVLTPFGRFNVGPQVSAIFMTSEGEMEILAGHEPMVAAIEPGILRVRGESGSWVAAVGEGFVRIKETATTILVDSAEAGSEINAERARAALQRAQERLDSDTPAWIRAQSKKAVARAIARIKASGEERGRRIQK